jgi:hydrogenase nickel incorporation protein HypA/HybF
MHELSIASAVVATVEKHAEGRRTCSVTLRVGRLRQVVPESLEFYFGFVSKATVCDGARLELVVVPGRLACSACGHEWELDEPAFWCPACASSDVRITAGNELEVESIEVEEEERACIAPR